MIYSKKKEVNMIRDDVKIIVTPTGVSLKKP